MSNLKKYKEKIEAKREELKGIDEVKEEDENVAKVVDGIDTILQKIEQGEEVNANYLAEAAAKLATRYSNLSVKMAEKRSMRDAAEQSYEELESKIILRKRSVCDTVTEAKSEAKTELEPVNAQLLRYRSEYRTYRAVEGAADKILSIIQSVIKTKLSDEIKSNMQK